MAAARDNETAQLIRKATATISPVFRSIVISRALCYYEITLPYYHRAANGMPRISAPVQAHNELRRTALVPWRPATINCGACDGLYLLTCIP